MIEKITIDNLTQDGVSIKKQKYTTVDGIEYPLGEPWRRAFVNSAKGREQIQLEVTEPYKTIILMMWGDTPTVSDNSDI